MKYKIEVDFEAEDESQARRLARIVIADARTTHEAVMHSTDLRAALLRPRPGDGTGYNVVPL